ncbi:MAG: hypothetical protein WC522_06365 [Candidatus Omnitrophota bacterium]
MKKVLLLVVAAVSVLCAGVAYAYEFSTDVVTTARSERFSGKMYVSDGKVRMESPQAVTITNTEKKLVWVLMPSQNMYMEQPMNFQSVAGATEKAPGEIERTLIGPDTVNGRPVKKYRVRCSTPQGETEMFQWMDAGINMPVKTAAVDGSWSTEFRNLAVGPQAPGLFELPAGYKKFAMPNMNDIMNAMKEQ